MQTERVTQLGLLPRIEPQNIPSKENVIRNASVSEVLVQILDAHPEIREGAVVRYSGMGSSNGEVSSSKIIYQLTYDGLYPSYLEYLSRTWNESVVGIDTGERDPKGAEIIHHDHQMLALASGVIVGREKIHIPMMDFAPDLDTEFEEDMAAAVDTIKRAGLKGYLFDSGNSFHFWGINLLKGDRWRSFINRGIQQEEWRIKTDARPIYDLGYLYASNQRGFSALRLFDYPPDKEEPKIVAVVN